MKLQPDDKKIERGGDMIESMFGISEDDSAHILMILRDKLYSDKIMAVIREYSANAQDAHAEVGKGNVPFKVILPSRLESSLRIRDYGPGLSEDEVRNLYVMYGASTKRNSNDAIGQLGLGCKSAFAYADQFTVTSWHGGKKKSYCAYIDETKRGKIALMSTEDAGDEPEGIEVQVPVDADDRSRFRTDAVKLLKFFEPQPEVVGETLELPNYWLTGDLGDGRKWGLSEDINYSQVIMGGVPYKIDSSSLNFEYGSSLYKLVELGIHLYINIGDAEVAANRESLEYTDRTCKNLKKYLEEASKKAVEDVGREIRDAMSYREANIAYVNLAKARKGFWSALDSSLKWQGKKVDGLVLPHSWTDYTLYQLNDNWRGVSFDDVQQVTAKEDIEIFDIDTEERIWKKRIRDYSGYHKFTFGKIYIIKWKNEQARKDCMSLRQLNEYHPHKLSRCKLPKGALKQLAAANPGGAAARSMSHVGNVFTLKPKDKWARDATCRSKDWERVTKALPKEIKYYLPIDKFRPEIFNRKGMGLTDINRLLTIANLLKLDINYTDIYGVKISQLPKLDKTWKRLDEHIKKAVEKSSIAKTAADGWAYDQDVPEAIKKCIPDRKSFPDRSTARELLDAVVILKKADEKINRTRRNILTWFNKLADLKSAKSSINIKKKIRAAKDKYPLPYICGLFPSSNDRYYGYYHGNSQIKDALPHLVEYIDFVENKNKDKKGKTNVKK
jgi:hypothetical protein